MDWGGREVGGQVCLAAVLTCARLLPPVSRLNRAGVERERSRSLSERARQRNRGADSGQGVRRSSQASPGSGVARWRSPRWRAEPRRSERDPASDKLPTLGGLLQLPHPALCGGGPGLTALREAGPAVGSWHQQGAGWSGSSRAARQRRRIVVNPWSEAT